MMIICFFLWSVWSFFYFYSMPCWEYFLWQTCCQKLPRGLNPQPPGPPAKCQDHLVAQIYITSVMMWSEDKRWKPSVDLPNHIRESIQKYSSLLSKAREEVKQKSVTLFLSAHPNRGCEKFWIFTVHLTVILYLLPQF